MKGGETVTNHEIIAGINQMAEALDEFGDLNIVIFRQVGIEAVGILKRDRDTIFVLTKEDVLECASEMGISEEAVTDDILTQVKEGVQWGLEYWSEVVKEAFNMALKS
jgi:hypothetical protein